MFNLPVDPMMHERMLLQRAMNPMMQQAQAPPAAAPPQEPGWLEWLFGPRTPSPTAEAAGAGYRTMTTPKKTGNALTDLQLAAQAELAKQEAAKRKKKPAK